MGTACLAPPSRSVLNNAVLCLGVLHSICGMAKTVGSMMSWEGRKMAQRVWHAPENSLVPCDDGGLCLVQRQALNLQQRVAVAIRLVRYSVMWSPSKDFMHTVVTQARTCSEC